MSGKFITIQQYYWAMALYIIAKQKEEEVSKLVEEMNTVLGQEDNCSNRFNKE